MLLKILGCSLVIVSSTIMGYTIADKYNRRPGELRALQAAFQMLESEIMYSLNVLPEAFDKISRSVPESTGMIFSYCSHLLKQRTGITAREAWTEAINKMCSKMCLEKQDLEILITFGNSLGNSDKENQIKNIHLACSKLAMEEKNADLLKEKNVKMFRNLGILGGILIALIFI